MKRHWPQSCLPSVARGCNLPIIVTLRYTRMRHVSRFVFLILITLAVTTAVRGQPVVLSKEAYLTPPKEIADAILATENENFTLTNLSPDGKKFLIVKNDGMPTL